MKFFSNDKIKKHGALKRIHEIVGEHAVSIPKKLYQSFTVDMGAVRRSLLVNAGHDVILLYGYYGTMYELLPIATFLSQKGFKIHLPHYDSTKPTVEAANDVLDYIKRLNLDSYSFVGHSKGGIIAKYLIDTYEDINKKTKKIITIATPHKGTLLGYLPFPNGYELRTGSNFLKKLEKKSVEEKIVAICNMQDMVIVPRSSQKVTYGKNIEIDVWGHANVTSYEKRLETVCEELKKA